MQGKSVTAGRQQENKPLPVQNVKPRGRGRPRLGVVSKEVTLLPRHWAWLAAQRGGASVTLRHLVDGARKTGELKDHARQSQDGTYRFMTAIGGDLPGFEEAIRALFAAQRDRFELEIKRWPEDVRMFVSRLAQDAFATAPVSANESEA